MSLEEGNAGTTAFAFEVTLSFEPPPAGASVLVDYTTVAGTATAGSDYIPVSGTLTFTPETPTRQEIIVNVIGDTAIETNETFSVVLSNLRGDAAFNDAIGLGTIFNDEATGTPTPTPTASPTPSVSPTPAGVEGDVVDAAGGPNGDGLVLANDVTAVRQFILGTQVPVNASQFQRADVNLVGGVPCGNGFLDAGDVTVIRQMILGVVPNNSPACGASGPVPTLVAESDAERPNSAAASISGRVTSIDGRGLRNATVTLTDALGEHRTAITGSFGYYSFDNVELGHPYILTIESNRIRFESALVLVEDSVIRADFAPLE